MKSTAKRTLARAHARGMTLLEVLVSLGIMVMISLLIYGAFDALSRGRKGEAMRVDRARQGRDAVDRMAHELQSAFLSLHVPVNQALVTRTTAFIAVNQNPFDRIDYTSFAHRRIEKEAKESDQCEIGYFVVKDPNVDEKMDLVRREQAPPDMDPKRGGVVNVLAEDVEAFDLRYLDPIAGVWIESWDTTQLSGQINRLPVAIRISLTLKGVKNSPPYKFTTKIIMPTQQALTFGIAR